MADRFEIIIPHIREIQQLRRHPSESPIIDADRCRRWDDRKPTSSEK